MADVQVVPSGNLWACEIDGHIRSMHETHEVRDRTAITRVAVADAVEFEHERVELLAHPSAFDARSDRCRLWTRPQPRFPGT